MSEQLTTSADWSNHWADHAESHQPRRGYAERLWNQVYDLVFADARPGEKCLEIGCGDSEHLPILAKRYGLAISGIDYTEVGCRLARQWLDKAGVSGWIEQRDLFKDNQDLHGQFDYVVSFGLVEHFDHPNMPLELMKRFLKTGGRILTTTPNVDPKSVTVHVQRMVGPEILAMHKLMTAEELKTFHERAGFKTIHCDYVGMGTLVTAGPEGARFKNWLVHSVSCRTLQVVRRSIELLRLPTPGTRRTGLFIVYIGQKDGPQ